MNRAGGCCSFLRGRAGRTRQRQGLIRKSILYAARAGRRACAGSLPGKVRPAGKAGPQGGFPADAAREAAHGPAV